MLQLVTVGGVFVDALEKRVHGDQLLSEWGQWWRKAKAYMPPLGYGESVTAKMLRDLKERSCFLCSSSKFIGMVKVELNGITHYKKCHACGGTGRVEPGRGRGKIPPGFIRSTHQWDDLDNEPYWCQEIDRIWLEMSHRQRLITVAQYVVHPRETIKTRLRIVNRKLNAEQAPPISKRTYERELARIRQYVSEQVDIKGI